MMDIQVLLDGILPLPALTVDDLRINFQAMRILRDAEEIHLTPTEWALLCVLAHHNGQLLTKARLIRLVWGDKYAGPESHNNLEMHIHRLRRKLECDPTRPRLIVNVPSIGYRLQARDTQ